MTLRPEYSLGHSEYNPFLFALVRSGQRGPGAEMDDLTVLSALTCLQFDPWQEAGRLADLPHDMAAHRLAETLARLPELNGRMVDAAAAAERLVALLPASAAPAVPLTPEASAAQRKATAGPGSAVQKPGHPTWVIWIVLAAATLAIAIHLQHDNNLESSARRGWTVER